MRLSETARLVWINLVQNKTKVLLTSVGIIVGSATIMLVVAIGTGGKEEVAEQFKNLNAGAIDISCDSSDSGGFSFEMPGRPAVILFALPTLAATAPSAEARKSEKSTGPCCGWSSWTAAVRVATVASHSRRYSVA